MQELGISSPLEKGILLEVCNKQDLLPADTQARLKNRLNREGQGVAISALTGEGIENLLTYIDKKLKEKGKILKVSVAAAAGEMLAWGYRQGIIVDREDEGEIIHLTLRVTPEQQARLASRFGVF